MKNKVGTLQLLTVAILAVLLHHCTHPHGTAVDVPKDARIVLTRTATGWVVETPTDTYSATSVNINADHLD